MSAQLQKRLLALEELQQAGNPEQYRKLKATIEAIFATLSVGDVDVPAELDALAGRIKSQATTDADGALMESWPKCHIEPAELVEIMATARDKF